MLSIPEQIRSAFNFKFPHFHCLYVFGRRVWECLAVCRNFCNPLFLNFLYPSLNGFSDGKVLPSGLKKGESYRYDIYYGMGGKSSRKEPCSFHVFIEILGPLRTYSYLSVPVHQSLYDRPKGFTKEKCKICLSIGFCAFKGGF